MGEIEFRLTAFASAEMSAPRPRTRTHSSASEWAQLSLLTVYGDEPVLAAAEGDVRLEDAALEAARVLYFVTPLEAGTVDAPRRNRIMGTVTGVQGFSRCARCSYRRRRGLTDDKWGNCPNIQDTRTARQQRLARSPLDQAQNGLV